MTEAQASRLRVFLGFVAIYLIWGSTYLGIRFTIETIPPLLSAGIRFMAGGVLLYLYCLLTGNGKADRREIGGSGVVGILMVAGGVGTVTWAEQFVPSGLTALIVGAVPFWLVLFDWLRPGGIRPLTPTVFGLIIGFLGIAILIGPVEVGDYSGVDIIGAVAIIIATMSWASGSIMSRHLPAPGSKLLGISYQMLTGGVFLFIVSSLLGEWGYVNFAAFSLKSFLSLAYLIVFGTLAYACYVWLLKVSTPARVGTYAFVNPIVAVLLGWLLAGEELSLQSLVAAMVIISAVILITRTRSARKQVVRPQRTGRRLGEPASASTCEAE